jgi:hypothetical protein
MSFTTKQEPDHIYYDLQATTAQGAGASIPVQQITFNEIRDNPFIYNPEDYYASIIRFRTDTNGIYLPLMIAPMDEDQAEVAPNQSVNRLIYTITMRQGTNQYQQAVYFEPQNVSVPVPTSTTRQDNTNGYYNLNSFQWFINLVNKAFENCLAGLNNMASVGNNARPPFIQLDPGSGQIQLFGQASLYDEALVNPILVFFNESLYNVFSSFQVFYQGPNVLSTTGLTIRESSSAPTPPAIPTFVAQTVSKARYRLRFYFNTPRNQLNSFTVNDTQTPYNNTLPPASSYPYSAITMFQDYLSLAPLCPIQSVFFTSSLLPISPSLTGAPQVFGSSTLVQSGNNANIVLQITDLELLNEKGTEYKPSILYAPSAQYRLIDMYGNAPLHQLDIQCFWKDRYGNAFPLVLAPGSSANIKLLFQKKSLIKKEDY